MCEEWYYVQEMQMVALHYPWFCGRNNNLHTVAGQLDFVFAVRSHYFSVLHGAFCVN